MPARLLPKVFGGSLIIVAAILGIVIRFNNPDMTEMRLWITFWPVYLVLLLMLGGGAWLIKEDW